MTLDFRGVAFACILMLAVLDTTSASETRGGSHGRFHLPHGVLVRDDHCSNLFEARPGPCCSRSSDALEALRARRSPLPLSQALVGTLRAAKKRKIVDYAGEMLLQGAHDAVEVVLLMPSWTPSATAAPAAAH